MCREEQQFLYFFLKKRQVQKTKNNNVYYLMIVLIKIRLLIFLVFSQYLLAWKYGNIFQIYIRNLKRNCIF